MKRTKLFLGTIAIAAAVGGLYVSNNVETISERSYYTEELSIERTKEQAWTQANEYLNSLRANPITGKVEPADYDAAYQHAISMNNQKAAAFTFGEDGPDNIGGRTRAIIVDPNNDYTVYAGSVDGGVYKSVNGGNNWNRLTSWDDNTLTGNQSIGTMSISSMCMTPNGTLYVGTGGKNLLGEGSMDSEGSGMQDGNGIWYSNDGGVTWFQLSGTQGDEISRVAADLSKNDVIYFVGDNLGMNRSTDKTVTNLNSDITANTDLVKVVVSSDGNVVVASGAAGVSRLYVSTNGGASFFNCIGNGTVVSPIANGGNRKECAISYEKNSAGYYNFYMAEESGGQMRGIWYSEDHGQNWYKIAPASTAGWTPCISANGQCYYDMVIDAIPGHPDHCIFGGIDLYRWEKTEGTAASDANGQWERISNWSSNQNSPNYVHADNHHLTWDSNGALYVGNDGGMSKSFTNETQFFTVINKGYNATQYYGIGYGPNGETIGGAQDNGTSYNDHTSSSGKSYAKVLGGDGFESEISFMGNGEVIYATIYGGSLSRSSDKGLNWQTADAPAAGSGFYNAIRLFEDDNDLDSKDSIQFIPDSSMSIGDIAEYSSESLNLPLTYTLTQNLTVFWDTVIPATDSVLPNFDTIPGGVPYLYNPIAQDTINLPDPKQSLFATMGDQVYITREMVRFSSSLVNNKPGDQPWWKTGTSGTAHSYEFSKDGDVLWIGTTNGVLHRVSGLDSAYSSTAGDVDYRPETGDTIINIATGDTVLGGFTTLDWSAANYRYGNFDDSSAVTYKLWTTSFTIGQIITDISTDPLNLDRVLITSGTSAGTIKLCTNATTTTSAGDFNDVSGNLPNYTMFGCEFIMNPNGDDIWMVGTEFGAYSSDNGGASWSAHTAETGIIPIFDVRQQWRDFNQGAKNPYEVFLGTFGRGIWTSDSYVGAGEHQVIDDVEGISGISIYPNPLSIEGNVAFELGNRSDVEFKVYDLQGKIINQVVWSNMNSGKHNMSFNVDKLPSGTYLVTLKAGTLTEVTKFIKY